MKTWGVELTAGGKTLDYVKIQRCIFQGDAISSLLFVIVMMIVESHIFTKKEKESKTLMHAAKICSQDIEMGFDREKGNIVIIRTEKWHMTEGIELPNKETSECSGKKLNLQVHGNIGSGHHQTKWKWKKKFKKSISGERGNYWKPNHIAEISSKDKR